MNRAILTSGFNWYEKRLQIIREELISRGYEVVVLLSDFDHIAKAPIKKRYEECIYLPTLSYSKNLSFARVRSHIDFGKSVAQFLKDSNPDLIYALVPPNSVAKQCLIYKQQHPIVDYVVDVIDLWPESMPISFLKKSFLARKWAEMRDQSLKQADGIVLECDLYRQSLPSDLKTSHITTLRLYSDYTEDELLLAEKVNQHHYFSPEQKQISFAYIGSLNSITDYEGILGIVKTFVSKGWQVTCHIIGEGQNRQEFISNLSATGCQVDYHGMIFDNSTKIKIVGVCDFAFNMMIDQVAVGLTMKSLDYLSIGLPIINSIKGDTWELVETCGIGLNYEGDPEQLCLECETLDYAKTRAKVSKVLRTQFTRQAFEGQVKSLLDTVLTKGE